ncbi:hypothetical protein ACH5RR_001979 [Cinchona calisaya]|uniref:Uncharacterized protein n=1 Tax=Cinchona calisaya TaxID=153742 RepID=A0ABD3B512_9GENT
MNDFDGDDTQEISPSRAKGVSINMLEAELEEPPVDNDIECSNSEQAEGYEKIEEDVDLESFRRKVIGLIDEDDEWLN